MYLLESVIQVNQTGFMPEKGSYINLRQLFLNLLTVHVNNGQRVIASLDSEKAFDFSGNFYGR